MWFWFSRRLSLITHWFLVVAKQSRTFQLPVFHQVYKKLWGSLSHDSSAGQRHIPHHMTLCSIYKPELAGRQICCLGTKELLASWLLSSWALCITWFVYSGFFSSSFPVLLNCSYTSPQWYFLSLFPILPSSHLERGISKQLCGPGFLLGLNCDKSDPKRCFASTHDCCKNAEYSM